MIKKIMTAGFALLVSMHGQAEEVFGEELPVIWTPIVTLSGGPAWSVPGENLFLYPTIPFPQIDNYIPDSPTGTLATGELFFGLQKMVFPGATGELGIGLAGSTDAKITGVVAVSGLPDFGRYEYKVDHGRVELKGRLIANTYRLQPYVSGSFGAGFNNSHDFRASTLSPLIYPAPWFATKTVLGFSYTLGLGAQLLLNRHWQVGIGYEFADWGKSGLGVDALTGIVGPNLDHLYTNELLFSLSYLF